MNAPVVPDAYQALVASSRVSTGTRRALQARAVADDPDYRPRALSPAHLEILRAVLRRVLPQPDDARIDLAARLDTQLHQGPGDGWRFASLPEDRTAYARALAVLDRQAQALHGQSFAAVSDDLQDSMLARAATGAMEAGTPDLLDGAQMQKWFEDVRSDAVKLYVAHPATLARMGYGGIGYGGDGDQKPGFTLLGLGERETWEPVQENGAGTP
jgi:hypothetical protein